MSPRPFAIAVGAVLALWLAWNAFKPRPTLVDLARSTVVDTFSGNDAAYMQTLSAREMKALGWSDADARRFFDRYLRPRYKPYKLIGIDRAWLQQGGASAVCAFRVRLPDGREVPQLLTVSYCDEGPCRTIRDSIVQAWALRGQSGPERIVKDVGPRSFWRYLQSDAATLRSLGFTQFVSIDPRNPSHPLDELLSRVSEARRAQKPSN